MITHIDFTPSEPCPPEPPSAARYRLQQSLENADAEWRSQVRKEYGSKLPIVIPAHWTRERVMYFANGGQHPQPAFVATIGQRVSAFPLKRKPMAGDTGLQGVA
jgi:hypothetical protein